MIFFTPVRTDDEMLEHWQKEKDNTVLHPTLLKTNQLNCDRKPLINKERQTKHQINKKKNKIEDLNIDKKTRMEDINTDNLLGKIWVIHIY